MLAEAMEHKDRYIREYAAVLMGVITAPPAETVPALVAMLQDEYPQGREAAAGALEKIGPPAWDAVPDIIQAYQGVEESGGNWQPYLNALKTITGEFLFRVEDWQAWWEEQ